MRPILSVLTLILCLMSLSAPMRSTRVAIANGSELSITGYTNLTNFNCTYTMDTFEHPIPVSYQESGDVLSFEKATLELRNIHFDCGGKGINRDFHKLLRTEEYPAIMLHLKEIRKIRSGKALAEVHIEIAGKTNRYQIPLELNRSNDLRARGILELQLTDFALETPTKAMGLITVKDRITIHFDLGILSN